MHRDLKPENILFKQPIALKRYGLEHVDDNVMIGDFGIASDIKPGNLDVYKFGGSVGYMAPEVFLA